MRVFVENLQFVGRHGVYERERAEGRTFRVDLSAELQQWAGADSIDETLDYRRLVNIVLEVGMGDSVQLIETLAHEIIDRLFEKHAIVASVELTIRKKATDVAGEPEWVGAGFELDRGDWNAQSRPDGRERT